MCESATATLCVWLRYVRVCYECCGYAMCESAIAVATLCASLLLLWLRYCVATLCVSLLLLCCGYAMCESAIAVATLCVRLLWCVSLLLLWLRYALLLLLRYV